MAANLFLNFGIGYEQAMAMRRSDTKALFESSAFKDWKKGRESKGKAEHAVLERLDNVIRAIGSLGKALTRSRREW